MDVSQGGSVIVNQTAPSSYPAIYTFEDGSEIRLEAVPAAGYQFESWSGDLAGTANPETIVIDCNKSVTASFSREGFQVRWPQVNWPVVSWIASCLVLAGLLVTVLIVRR